MTNWNCLNGFRSVTTWRLWMATLGLFSLESIATAHPGHEMLPLENQSFTHYLLEPVHSVPALIAGALLLLVVFLLRRTVKPRQNRMR